MSFFSIFRKSNAFLPVIHVTDDRQALRNANIAAENGADGIFLICHEDDAEGSKLLFAYDCVRRAHQNWWIGLNFLSTELEAVIDLLPADASGYWSDTAGLLPVGKDRFEIARRVHQHRLAHPNKQLLSFGGVSFKHQDDTNDVEQAVRDAADAQPYVDVITTSGSRTGTPPSIQKIQAMKAVLKLHPLAIASGMASENVEPFLPCTEAFLVATSISKNFYELDPKKVRAFAHAIGR